VLCEAHGRRLNALGRSDANRQTPSPDKIEPWLNDKWMRICERNVKAGRRRFDADAQIYRFTWKGATLAVLNSLPAVRQFRNRRSEKQARRLWNELGMENFAATRATDDATEANLHNATQMLRNPPSLAAGEIRYDRADGLLVAHVGGYSITKIIALGWFEIMQIVLISLIFTLFVAGNYFFWVLLPAGVPVGIYIPVAAVLWLFFILRPVIRLARGLACSSRIISLAASTAGLCCRGVSRLHDEKIPRSDIEQISATKFRFGRRWVGRISIRRFDTQMRQILVPFGDVSKLVTLRKELAETIGIDAPVVPPPLPQSVSVGA
jgi:hypothetical protein